MNGLSTDNYDTISHPSREVIRGNVLYCWTVASGVGSGGVGGYPFKVIYLSWLYLSGVWEYPAGVAQAEQRNR